VQAPGPDQATALQHHGCVKQAEPDALDRAEANGVAGLSIRIVPQRPGYCLERCRTSGATPPPRP
jgi:hypothetical protein